ncbi:glutamate--tRNA ligase [Anoxybacter fermentans]|uniref:Glutamate--tRNA ligase n=1 Tax=Anoxybacter fermentans TaxID=1323375 RepID=A0A3S9T195_9FIRM|nr:glutamate--tRNA ligase [Anoxybacter fermentans]AZR74192.1 glutamate--tRNA ligase [Anoxybacter fermentans]
MSEVRVRFAPSPTGYLHVGSLRTALYNYLFARRNNGKVILRIEDTDRERLVEDAIEKMINTFKRVNLEFDEGPVQGGDYGPYIQSERKHLYQKYAKQLVETGHAYYCFCSKEELDEMRKKQIESGQAPKYDKRCLKLSKEEVQKRLDAGEPYVIRLNVPSGRTITFNDLIHGPTTFETDNIDDQILLKSDGFPTYHLAVVIDDHHMGITHVLRADEWIPSTPKHILLYEAFGWEPPKFGHIPLLVNTEGKKLSKRDGDVSVEDYLNKGYLPEALINYLALLGWNPGTEEEFFTLKELEQRFSLDRVNDSAGVFDIEKLNWMNGKYIRSKELDEIVEMVKPYLENAGYTIPEDEERFKWMVEAVYQDLDYLAQITDKMEIFYRDKFEVTDPKSLELLELDSSRKLFKVLKEKFESVEKITPDNFQELIKVAGKEAGVKGKLLYMPIRLAVSGQQHGPDLKLLICGLGKERAIERLSHWI